MVRKPSSPTGSMSAAAATATLLHGDDHINVRLNGKVGKGASPSLWSHSDVAAWLRDAGFAHYAQLLAETHKIDGASLLQLSESDLREPPLSMSCLGDIKRLGHALQALRDAEEARKRNELFLLHCDNGVDVAAVISDDDVMDTLSTSGTVRLMSRDSLIRHVESPDTRAKSVLKLAIAAGYCAASLLITAFVMVLVHDRVPDMKTYPPLPDIVLDNLPLIPWAFEACECIGVVLSGIWFTVLFFHKQRVVIARRMFSMVGTVFLLRCITMLITSLSVPGVHLECSAKSFGSTSDKFWQALKIWSKLGMSIQGVRTCGDYMFSGHTTAITLLNHFITEYTPSSWTGLHTMTWVMNLFGVFFILAGHEHYSIDVFIAFYISSRMFLYYHAYAYNHANLTATDDRMRLWFPLGWFFEAGSVGKCPNEFEVPFSIKGTKRRILSLLGVGGSSERDREHDRFYPASPRHGDDVRFGVETRSTKARQAMKKKNK